MLVVRAIKLAHKKFHNENLDLIRNILVKNDYPCEFTEKYIKRRMFMITSCDKNKNCDIDNRFTIVLQYLKKLHYPIYNALKPYNIQLISSIKKQISFCKIRKRHY